MHNTFFLFDSIGLALFTVVGVGKSIALGYPFWVAIIMGVSLGPQVVCSAMFLLMKFRLFFVKNLCNGLCGGGLAYWICDLFGLEAFICQIIGGSTVFLARILAVKYSICLPILKGEQR